MNLTKNRLDHRIAVMAGKSRWFFIWLAVLFALFFNNPGIASYEPFSPFFGGEANVAQWILMGLLLVLSIVVFRFWCRLFCPVGAILDLLAKFKRYVKKVFAKKRGARSGTVFHNNESGGCTSCKTCQAHYGEKEKGLGKGASGGMGTAPLSTFNKFIIFVIVIIDLLIIAALLQNTGLI